MVVDCPPVALAAAGDVPTAPVPAVIALASAGASVAAANTTHR